MALTRSTHGVVGAAGGLTRLFDSAGYSRVGGAAVLLPRGTSSPEAVREVVAAGARAVLVDGPLPAGSLGNRRPGRGPDPRPVRRDADAVRAALRDAVPVTLAVGAAAFDANAGRGEAAPFSSEGLAFDGGPKPELSAAGIGLATSDPGRNEDGAARYGTLSGSSAAAALTAGAAALLAEARPDLDAAGLKQALVASARRGGVRRASSTRRAQRRSSSSPTRRGRARRCAPENTTVSRRVVTLRNVSRRTLDVTIEPGTADAADIVVEVRPRVARLKPGRPGRSRSRRPSAPAAAPAALGGALRVKFADGSTLRVPWTIAVPLPNRDLIPSARLSSRTFEPSDVEPAVLTVVAGRVDGSAERPQLLPLEELDDRPLPRRAAARAARARARRAARALFVRHHRARGGRRPPAARRVRAAPRGHAGRRG